MARISKEKQEEIRKRILTVAFEFFQEKGYEETNTRDITQRVGIAEGTLYNYFPDKASLFLEAMVAGFQDSMSGPVIQESVCPTIEDFHRFLSNQLQVFFSYPKDTMRQILAVFLGLYQKESPLVKELASFDYRYLEEMQSIFDRWVKEGIMKPCDTHLAASAVFSAMIFEMMGFLFDDHCSVEDVFKAVKKKTDFILDGWINRGPPLPNTSK